MPNVIWDMSMSLDGFIADEDDYLGGEDGERLHAWADGSDKVVTRFMDEWKSGGAVIAGRRLAELMDHWGGTHQGLPIFVPSHRPPSPAARWGYPQVTYVREGIERTVASATAAAGERDVQLRGGYTGRRAVEAGVIDEIQIHLVPVLLGRGRRMFDVLPAEVELEVVDVVDTPAATHIRYRVRR